jgi:hypothetical protein
LIAEIGNCELEYTAELTGSVNGQPICLEGRGHINSKDGLTSGEYELHKLPRDFDPLFLTAVLITGYPNACASLDGVSNPFVGLSYEYVRQIAFRSARSLELKTRCQLNGRHLSSEFRLTGSSPVASLGTVEPLVETWESLGPGQIEGRFKVAWTTSGGEQLTAQTETEYAIPQSVPEICLMHRFIEIESRLVGTRLSLKQHSFAFRHLKRSHTTAH